MIELAEMEIQNVYKVRVYIDYLEVFLPNSVLT